MSPSVRGGVATAALASTIVVPLALSWSQFSQTPWATAATAAILAAGLIVRRRPLIGLSLATAAALLGVVADQGPWPYPAMVVIAFTCGRTRSAGRRVWLVTVGTALAGAALGITGRADPIALLLTLVGAVVVPWWIGSDARVRAALRDAGWERAARLEREQQLAVDAVRQEERARLAAEMHDALGYELSVLALTAGAGEVDPANTAEQRVQFARTREAAVRAVESLHDVLRILREDESGAEISSPDAIASLIARSGHGEFDLEATLDIDPGRWSDALRRGSFRIVQELLTNAAKHAPGRRVRLSVADTEDEVVIRTVNPRSERSTTPPGSGSGLAGIAERARVLGGTMTISEESGRFAIAVTLPIRSPVGQRPLSVPSRPIIEAPERGQGSRRWQAALFPVAALLAVCGLLLALNAATVERIGLSAQALNRLHVGMTLDEAAPELPPSHLDELPAAFAPLSPPDGAQCRFYRGTDSWLDLGERYVRLCFADGVLIAKEQIS